MTVVSHVGDKRKDGWQVARWVIVTTFVPPIFPLFSFFYAHVVVVIPPATIGAGGIPIEPSRRGAGGIPINE